MKELGEGSRDMTVTMTGWDINPRVLGIVPKEYKVTPFKGMTWVNDAHYMVIPKGVPPEKIAVVLDLMAFLLTPEAQAYTYDKGYFYPGPGGEERVAVDGAEGEPGGDQGVRPAGVREVARRVPAHAVAAAGGAGRRLPHLGPAGRGEDQEVTRMSERAAARRDRKQMRHPGERGSQGRELTERPAFPLRGTRSRSAISMKHDFRSSSSTASRAASPAPAARRSPR